ncbi:MAG: ubiquitin-like domain-containing protein [Caldilineales bacterium]|nr:ubiquitin-like domain-containing protein [Caldilineales bacterium]MDW8317439.1 ubiquitin-like domain-containing protein [Anaerolineae bacterium]
MHLAADQASPVVSAPSHPLASPTAAVGRGRTVAVLSAAGNALAALAAVAALVWGYFAAATPVAVTVDGAEAVVYTHQATVGDLLQELEVPLAPEDRVWPPLDASLARGTDGRAFTVQVQRAQPLMVDGDGQRRLLRTHAATLGEALAEAGISLGPADEVTLEGRPAGGDTSLPPLTVDRNPSPLPGVKPAYPWQSALPRPLTVQLRRAVPVTVHNGGPPLTLWSTATTVGEALAHEGMLLYVGDRVQPGLGTPLTAGLHVYIERAKPVTVRTQDGSLRTRTLADTVADLLVEQGIVLAGLDRVEPALDTRLTDHMAIRITRVEHRYEVEEDVTRYTTVWLPDADMELDSSRLEIEGVNGITRHRYLVVLEDGRPITRTLQDTWLAQEPITRTFRYGTKIVVRELETPDGPITYWRKVRMFVTSYSPANSGVSPDRPWYGRTRLGIPIRRGLVAVDPAVIPLRTQLYVPGYGFAMAADTGSGVRGRWVDLAFTDAEYVPWARCVDVYLIGPPPPSYMITYRLPSYPNVRCMRR